MPLLQGNQRIRVRITSVPGAKLEVEAQEMVWLEELVEYAEASASTPLYGLLKRPDEKYVTEHAYEIRVL